MSDDQKKDYAVGYRKPPLHTRFQKGQSGNPNGRPKGSLNLATVLAKTLRERVVINENGRRHAISKLEAAIKQLVNKAAHGDIPALKHLLQLVQLAEGREAGNGATVPALPAMDAADQEVLALIIKRFAGTPEGTDDSSTR